LVLVVDIFVEKPSFDYVIAVIGECKIFLKVVTEEATNNCQDESRRKCLNLQRSSIKEHEGVCAVYAS